MSTPGTAPFLIPAPELTDAANIETAIEPLRDRIEVVLAQMLVPIGGLLAYAGSGDPAGGSWLLADGRLIDRTTYADFFAAVGHAYNGGVDPGSNKVRLPDKRGRVSVGADTMRTVVDALGNAASGAGGRLTTAAGHNNARGQSGGFERHTLTGRESGIQDHTTSIPQRMNQTSPSNEPWDSGGKVPYVARSANFDGAMSTPGTGHIAALDPHNNTQPYEIDNVIVRVA